MKTINKASVISTKKGDNGCTKNYSNQSISKSDILFDVIGEIDELSSLLGLTYHYSSYKTEIKIIQRHLQDIMSLIATNVDDSRFNKLTQITDKEIEFLEFLEQEILMKKEIEARFVLPGSETSKEGAYLDVSRSITRRVERTFSKYLDLHKRDELHKVVAYINRLSDLLFIMARSKK